MVSWFQKNYDDLTKDELYSIIQFRIGIFVIEQNSIYEDLDNLDQQAMHFIGMDNNKIVVYGRVHIDAKTHFAVIRRICVHKDYRDQKLGHAVMEKIMEYVKAVPNLKGSELDAQHHLQRFYEKFGFHADGEPYEDGGVMHIQMVKTQQGILLGKEGGIKCGCQMK